MPKLIYNYSEDERYKDISTNNNKDAILDSFKTTFSAFVKGRSLGLVSVILRISFLCILLFLFTIYIEQFLKQSIVHSNSSSERVDGCLLHCCDLNSTADAMSRNICNVRRY